MLPAQQSNKPVLYMQVERLRKILRLDHSMMHRILTGCLFRKLVEES